MKTITNQPKVRVGTEAADLDFLLDQVANGDLTLAYVFTKAGSDAGNMLRAADWCEAHGNAVEEARAEFLADREAEGY